MSCANNLIMVFGGYVWLFGLAWFGFCSARAICLNLSKSQKLPFLKSCPLDRAETFLDKNPSVFP